MNDLRLILLGIGLLIIAAIYFWGTYRQKAQNRSQMRKLTSFKRDTFIHKHFSSEPDHQPEHKHELDPDDDEVDAESVAELNEFLSNPKSTTINPSDFSLRVNIDVPRDVPEEKKDGKKDKQSAYKLSSKEPVVQTKSVVSSTADKKQEQSNQASGDPQIITFLIKASPDNAFSGSALLKAIEGVGFQFGDMKIFHHHGVDELSSEQAIFSLASMYEPGYFEIDRMRTYQTMGLVMFMQLPAPVDNMAAFALMQETAMKLADMLDGEIWSSKHKPIDEKVLLAMRDVVAASS